MTHHILGIDVGGTMIKGGLFTEQGRLIAKDSVATNPEEGPEKFGNAVEALSKKLTAGHGNADAMGIGIAGVLDNERTTLVESPNLPALNNFAVQSVLSDQLGIPVLIENDANVAALGELWAGSGKGLENFLMFTLGTGIGSGLILNGALWTGETGKAGEFGHIIVDTGPDAPLCGCGKRGCIEAHGSGTAIVRMAREALDSGKNTALRAQFADTPGDITPEAVYHEAVKGDEVCKEIYKTATCYLAVALSNINNLLDIHDFIIGGGVSKAFDLFEADLYDETRKRIFSVSRDKVRITLSALGNDAGMYGAAYLAHRQSN